MKTTLVTGSAGFLGFHLCSKLLAEGYHVIGIDNYITGQKKNTEILVKGFPDRFHFVEADISADWQLWQNSIPSDWLSFVKYVFHFASVPSPSLFERYSLEIMQANSVGLRNAISFADTHQAKVIFASTSEVYGSQNKPCFSESDWGHVNSFGVRSCYDESKRFGEALIFSSNQKNKSRHGLVRIFNTYGPNMHPQDSRVIQSFLTKAKTAETVKIYGDGNQTRSFCYVDDLIEAVITYAMKDLTIPVNIGCDEEISLNQLVKIIGIIFHQELAISFVSKRSDDPIMRRPDLTLALKLLTPWYPKITLEEGLRRTSTFLTSRP